jgi:hypothetical protein
LKILTTFIVFFQTGDVVTEIKDESDESKEENESPKYILGPGLRREGSTVYVMQSGVLKCRKAGMNNYTKFYSWLYQI